MLAKILLRLLNIRPKPGVAIGIICMLVASSVMAQATSRPCTGGSEKEEQPGPACLLSHQALGHLPGSAVYWSLYTYPSVEIARQEKIDQAAIIEAFGRVWLFIVGPQRTRVLGGQHVAEVGPIPVNDGVSYDAEFLKSTFSVGMTAPVHVHSGPEAFFAVSGNTCLETPDGVQVGRGAGNKLVVRGGPPMLLMAIGPEPRKGFALILHDKALPPTTLVHDWVPKGLCQAQLGQ